MTGFEPAASWSQTGTENFFRTFLTVFYRFRSYSVTLVPSFEPPFPPVPRASVVIHVVKNASRQKKTGSVFTFISWLIQRNTASYLRCHHPCRRTIRNQRDSFCSGQLHQIHRVNASCRQCLSYFDYISSLKNPDCNEALKRVCSRIDLDAIHNFLEDVPELLPIQREFYLTMLTERKEKILDYSLELLMEQEQHTSPTLGM